MKIQVVRGWLIVFALGLVGCEEEVVPDPPPRRAYVVEVEAPNATTARSFSGQLESAQGVALSFETGGRVLRVNAREGQRYEPGFVLAVVDDSDTRNELADAEAQFRQSEQELRRMQRLFESGNASRSQLDGAIAQEQSLRAAVARVKERLQKCSLTMPYPGVIATVDADAQQVVAAGETVMTIQGEGAMEFTIGVPAEVIANVEVGMPAQLALGALPDAPLSASVSEVSTQISSNTTYAVTLKLDNNTAAARAGMDGEATLELPNPAGNVVRLPLTCTVGAPGGSAYVWIVERHSGGGTGTVVRRPVTLGQLREEGRVEVTSGVSPGEWVISRGVHRVEAGMIVALATEAATP